MPDGGCFCGKVRISYTGEPQLKALCHCLDCRKISGSTYSTNIAVKEDGFNLVSGTPKSISKTPDSGNTITSHFCPDCGTTLWRDGKSFEGLKIIKVGVTDDIEALAAVKPGVELYAGTRVDWVPSIPGAKQAQGMA